MKMIRNPIISNPFEIGSYVIVRQTPYMRERNSRMGWIPTVYKVLGYLNCSAKETATKCGIESCIGQTQVMLQQCVQRQRVVYERRRPENGLAYCLYKVMGRRRRWYNRAEIPDGPAKKPKKPTLAWELFEGEVHSAAEYALIVGAET